MSHFLGSWSFRVVSRSFATGVAALVPAVVAASWLSSSHGATSSIVSCKSNNDNDNNNPEPSLSFFSPTKNQHDATTRPSTTTGNDFDHSATTSRIKAGMVGGGDDEYGSFYGLFPKRQLWQPAKPYPLWDEDWDGRKPASLGDLELDLQRDRNIRNKGVTRHIILIRHGQYDETHKEDAKQMLTTLGREQAELTGKRLAELLKGVNETFGPCNVKYIRVSNLTRAKETAEIIAKHLPGIPEAEPDVNLNEGRPAHNIPGGTARPSVIQKTDECHPRIETAFQTYFYRADPPQQKKKTLVLVPENIIDDPDHGGKKQSESTDNASTSIVVSSATPKTTNSDVTCDPQKENNDANVISTVGVREEEEEQHEFEIIIGHANVIRYFFCRALQLPPEAWLRLCIFNCSLTYFTIRPTGTVSCRMLGDIGHLGYDHSTFSMHHGFNW